MRNVQTHQSHLTVTAKKALVEMEELVRVCDGDKILLVTRYSCRAAELTSNECKHGRLHD